MVTTGFAIGMLCVLFGDLLVNFINVRLLTVLGIQTIADFYLYWTSYKLALLAAGANVVSPEEAPELHAMIERLCAMADVPKPRIAIIDSDVPNAFATGRNPKHAAVAVTTGLWRRLPPNEV